MDSIACFAEQNSMVKTSFRTGFPICHRHIGFKWVRIHFPDPTQKKAPPDGDAFFWWGKVDSNHRSYKQQIYSLSPLATREFPQIFSSCRNLFIIAYFGKMSRTFLVPGAGSALQAEDLPRENGLSADFLDMFQLLGCKGGVFRCLDVIQNLAGLRGTDEDGGDRFVV